MTQQTPEQMEALMASISQVLEEAAFMFVEPCEDEDPPPFEGETLTSTMRFLGSATGTIFLATGADTCMGLASELTGLDEDDLTAADGEASLGELLNIVAGVLMQSLYGASALIELQPPEIQQGAACGATARVSVLTDMGQRFDLSLEV